MESFGSAPHESCDQKSTLIYTLAYSHTLSYSAGLSQGPPVQIQYGVLIAIFSCMAFSNFFKFVHWLQYWCGNEARAFWQFPGSFCTLFLPFYGHFLSEKCGVWGASVFAAVFFFIFPPMTTWVWVDCSNQNSIILCWFYPSSSWRGDKKRMKVEKSTDAEWISTGAVRLVLIPSREVEWKRKCAGKSSSSSPHFMRKREQIFGTKSVLLGSKVTGRSAFSKEDLFYGRFFSAKETTINSDEIIVKMKQKFCVGAMA